jgi:hypothetical protein
MVGEARNDGERRSSWGTFEEFPLHMRLHGIITYKKMDILKNGYIKK